MISTKDLNAHTGGVVSSPRAIRDAVNTPWDYKHPKLEPSQKGWPYEETDPNGKQAKEPGSKLDAGKSPVMQGVLQYFPRALLEIGRVSEEGAKEYTWRGWETVSNGEIRYGNALSRHLLMEGIEGEYDSKTGLLHAAQEAWNALARLELILREKQK